MKKQVRTGPFRGFGGGLRGRVRLSRAEIRWRHGRGVGAGSSGAGGAGQEGEQLGTGDMPLGAWNDGKSIENQWKINRNE